MLVLLGLGMLALATFGDRLRVSYRTALSGCAYDNGTGGASGLYRWCGRMGLPTTLLDVPLAEAFEALDSPTGNVVLTMGDGSWSPSDEEMGAEDWRTIHAWLERGNTLIVATTKPAELPAPLQNGLLAGKLREVDGGMVGPPAPAAPRREDPVENRPETVEAPTAGDGSLAVEAKGPRWTATGEADKADEARWRLAKDSRGGVLYRIPVGRGACYILLDAFAWTNAGLDAGENAKVLGAILGREVDEGTLAIDEHRHGHGRAESFGTYLVGLPGAPAFLWLALAWAVLYYYGRNVRLSPAETYELRERRTAQEYINAVAQIHERARAAPLAVEAVAARLRQLVRSASGSDPAAEALLEEADAYVESGRRPSSPREAVRLVTRLVQLRKRLYGTRTVS